MRDPEDIVSKALAAAGEAEAFAFKRDFQATAAGWLDAVRDMAALANSGGGVIFFGLDEHGVPSGADLSALDGVDATAIANEFQKFTGVRPGIQKRALEKAGQRLVAWLVAEADHPIPFIHANANPALGHNSQPGASAPAGPARGSVYFRHGAKSEPAEPADFARFFERKLEQKRKLWTEAIRQVMETPAGKMAVVLYDDEPQPLTAALPEAAPRYVPADPDRTHPYTPKELIATFNERVSDRRINNYDILAVRYHHGLDDREEFIFHIHMASPRYSDQFLEWLIGCHRADPEFFDHARAAYGNMLKRKRRRKRQQ